VLGSLLLPRRVHLVLGATRLSRRGALQEPLPAGALSLVAGRLPVLLARSSTSARRALIARTSDDGTPATSQATRLTRPAGPRTRRRSIGHPRRRSRSARSADAWGVQFRAEQRDRIRVDRAKAAGLVERADQNVVDVELRVGDVRPLLSWAVVWRLTPTQSCARTRRTSRGPGPNRSRTNGPSSSIRRWRRSR